MMDRQTEPGAYKEVHSLIESLDPEGGRMWWRSRAPEDEASG